MSEYHIYDVNKAYEDFVSRFGVEPNGLLMREETYLMLKDNVQGQYILPPEINDMKFRGMPIFRSQQTEINSIRFVI